MIMKDLYIFPAIFSYESDGISIEFPDLPGCFSCAYSNYEAMQNAREAMSLYLYCSEIDNEIIPEPSNILEISREKNQAVVFIDIFMPPVRDEMKAKHIAA